MAGPSWVQHISTGGSSYGSRTSELTDDELHFLKNHDRAETLVETEDPHADYSYDDYALAVLDEQFYVFNTSGCSCPSPSETWDLIFKGDQLELVIFLEGLRDKNEACNEFLRGAEDHGILLQSPAPNPNKRRYDW